MFKNKKNKKVAHVLVTVSSTVYPRISVLAVSFSEFSFLDNYHRLVYEGLVKFSRTDKESLQNKILRSGSSQ